MRLIAHRGNVNGPNRDVENTIGQIDKCIENGYDVEIDLRYDAASQIFWLGHDKPKNVISFFELAKRSQYLWIHCKDITTLHAFANGTSGYNYFWHQEDDFTLTSKQYIWTYPGKPYTNQSVIVMPEWNEPDWDTLRVTDCYGICTDYVEKLR